MKTRIGIRGMGLVSCLGTGTETVFDAMLRGACGIRRIDRFDPAPYPQPNGGQIPEHEEHRLRDQFPDDDLAIAMVKEAGREALGTTAFSVERLGLVLATNFGPVESLEWSWRERLDLGTLDPETFAMADRVARTTADFFGAQGPRVQISMSCASGAAAVFQAKQWIEEDRADAVLAIGYDGLSEFVWCGLTNLRTITTDCMRPFDQKRSGTIFSEGAAAMLLCNETADSTPLAHVAGAAVNNNAFHMTAPPRGAEGSRRVMAAALDDAGMRPEDVQHVCAHATATSANDGSEVQALRALFGDQLETMTVAAHKSQLGHMMGAAGLAEAIVTVAALRSGRIPPTVNHEQADSECAVDCIPGTARDRRFKIAITNSAGIGGNNGSLLLEAAS